MLPDAVKNPLIYLNFAVYCVQLKRYDLAVTNLTNFFSVAEHVNVRHEVSQLFTLNIGFDAKIKWMTLSSLYTQFKTIAERMREFLPQPSISNSQTVEVEHSTEPIPNADSEGAGDAMSPLDENENLV